MRRMTILRGFIVAVAVAALISVALSGDQARAQTTVNVEVGDVYFCNASFAGGVCDTTIAVGDTVMWNWTGSLPHTVTQCDPTFATCPPPGGFDSGTLTGAGQNFSQTFNTAGTFPYQCNIHTAGMRGRIIVAAAQATPTSTAGAVTPAQTGTAGPTATAAPVATGTAGAGAATPATVPGTGGDADSDGLALPFVLAVAGVLVIVSTGAGLILLRRR